MGIPDGPDVIGGSRRSGAAGGYDQNKDLVVLDQLLGGGHALGRRRRVLEYHPELAPVDRAGLVDLVDRKLHVVAPGRADECEGATQLPERADQHLVVGHALSSLRRRRAGAKTGSRGCDDASGRSKNGAPVDAIGPAHSCLRFPRLWPAAIMNGARIVDAAAGFFRAQEQVYECPAKVCNRPIDCICRYIVRPQKSHPASFA